MQNSTQNSNEQRTQEWKQDRYGKFSASGIHKLLGVRGLGETGKSYAIEKAIEDLYGEMEENFVSYDMQRGIDLEPLAFNKFQELKQSDFLEVSNCNFFKNCDHSGASPDGLVSNNSVLEIKCPKSTTFFELVATNEVSKQYFSQMQMQMMSTGSEKAYFFNYLIHKGEEFWHEIIIERCEKTIDLIKERLDEAIKIKLEYISKIETNKQF